VGARAAERGAATILLIVGSLLLASAAAGYLAALPDLTAAEGGELAGDATLWVMFVVVPQVVGGLLALLVAWLLWAGRPGGRVLALVWVAVGAMASAMTYVATGNALGAVRMIVVEAATGWWVSWPQLAITTADGSTYYARIDAATFWIPVAVAVATLAVLALVIAAAIAQARNERLALPE
jgi:hypothetical protein